ncbi:hypothetical protein [Streptomyces sp. NPDC008122]|uniref:hypothetical protein n=1 Tax=Streptomyces sp. NPDC008122 TaxID=3364810 RepID=UPI0036EF609E
MKKILATTALALAGIALAAPAHADDWDFATSAVVPDTLGQEIAKVPVLAPYVGGQMNNAANGNVLDHPKP